MTDHKLNFNGSILEYVTTKGGVIRCAVGSFDGLRGSTWRLWGNKKGDIYLSTRQMGGTFKASLHKDRNCQLGFTSEFEDEARTNFSHVGSRHWHKWRLPDIPVAQAIQILLPDSELRAFRPEGESSSALFWLPLPSFNSVSVITIYIIVKKVHEIRLPENLQGVQPLGIIPTEKVVALVAYSSNPLDENSKKFIEEKRKLVKSRTVNFEWANSPGLRTIIPFGHEGQYCQYFLELALD